MDSKIKSSLFSPQLTKQTLSIYSSVKKYHPTIHHPQSDFRRINQGPAYTSYHTSNKNMFQQPLHRKTQNLEKLRRETKHENNELILTDTGYHSKLLQKDSSKLIIQQNKVMRNIVQQNEEIKNRIVKKFSVLFEQYLKQINLNTIQQKAKEFIKITKNKKLQYQNMTIEKLFDICVDIIFIFSQQYKKMQKEYQTLSQIMPNRKQKSNLATSNSDKTIDELKFQINNLNEILLATEIQKANAIKKTNQILQKAGHKKIKKTLKQLQVQNEVLIIKLKQYKQKYEKQAEQMAQYKLEGQQKYKKIYQYVKKMKRNEKCNWKPTNNG